MNTPPEISIIVPVYNVEPYLSRCLDSILNQTFTAFECILVDDCSPDNCPAICDDYARKDQRIRVIHNQQNQGSSLSRQIGLQQAAGDYILFIDSDDWIEKEMVEEMYSKAIDDNSDIIYCDFYDEQFNKQVTCYTSNNNDKILLFKHLLTMRINPRVTILVRKSLYAKIFFPQDSFSEDWVISTQLLYFAERIGYIAKPFYHRCYNPNSLCNDKQNTTQKTMEFFNNFVAVTQLLHTYFEDMSAFEPELSNRINKVKLGFILDKQTRDIQKLFDLYPQSNQLIFNNDSKLPFYHKILLLGATKKIVFPLRVLDVFYAFRKKLSTHNHPQ